jgi:enoyl-CoA hydratase/carnithine racemase
MFCSTPGVALVRVVPRQLANWMLYTGEPITAQQALQVGLVAKICGEDQLGINRMIRLFLLINSLKM